MRVASSTLPGILVQQLHDLGNRQNRLQTEAATGQRIQWADDDPVAMRQALQFQTDAGVNAQYGRNIATLQSRLESGTDAIRGLQRVVDRTREIAVLADGTRSPTELGAYAAEVDQLLRQAVQTANTRHGDQYLFGGTRTDRPPFVIREDASGRAIGVDYQGNQDAAGVEIAPDSVVTASIPGANPAATGPAGLVTDSRSGADLFAHMLALRDRLEEGDTSAIASTDRAALEKDEETLIDRLAEAGALQARLETTAAASRSQGSRLEEALTRVSAADLPETLSRLAQTQVAYQAALQSGAQLLRTSLMDYLR